MECVVVPRQKFVFACRTLKIRLQAVATYLSGPLFEMAHAQGFQRRRQNQKKASQQMQVAEANMRRLGSQAPERLEQIGRFMEAHAGRQGRSGGAEKAFDRPDGRGLRAFRAQDYPGEWRTRFSAWAQQ